MYSKWGDINPTQRPNASLTCLGMQWYWTRWGIPSDVLASFSLHLIPPREKHSICQASLCSESSIFHTRESCSDLVIELDGKLPVLSRMHSKRVHSRSRLHKVNLSLEPHDPKVRRTHMTRGIFVKNYTWLSLWQAPKNRITGKSLWLWSNATPSPAEN